MAGSFLLGNGVEEGAEERLPLNGKVTISVGREDAGRLIVVSDFVTKEKISS